MKTRIMYVEDEPLLGKIVTDGLRLQGFEVDWTTDGATVLDNFASFAPHLCVLDIMLPNVDGYTLCREIRKRNPNMPIIFLTARAETVDLVKGFEAGGTDYIRKPFSLEELTVRIENQMRLNANSALMTESLQEEIHLGKFRLFPARHELHSPSSVIRLSRRDIEVLGILTANRNHSVNRKQILLAIWGDDSFFNSRTLDVYIRKLRGYFREDPALEIVTLKGLGYLFLVP